MRKSHPRTGPLGGFNNAGRETVFLMGELQNKMEKKEKSLVKSQHWCSSVCAAWQIPDKSILAQASFLAQLWRPLQIPPLTSGDIMCLALFWGVIDASSLGGEALAPEWRAEGYRK